MSDGEYRRAFEVSASFGVKRIAVPLRRGINFNRSADEIDRAVGIDPVAVRHVDVNGSAVLIIAEAVTCQIGICGVDPVVGRVDRDIAGIDVQSGSFDTFGRLYYVDRRSARSFRTDVHDVITLDPVVNGGDRDIS